MTARTIMVQGTASSVGKSLIVAALCRIFRDLGYRVAPFKSQNMALNSAATGEGLEIGRAQAVQARAARVPPSVDMNPILLKPETDMRAQVVLRGRPIGSMRFGEYQQRRPELVRAIEDSLGRLRSAYDIVVIEGAGSPAEINLKDRDLVNGFVANLADAPVLLVGDIDRGGVFASLFGTIALLDEAERARIKGLLINKFRGEYEILAPALPMIEARLGVPVLGVVPFIRELRLPEEDGMALQDRRTAPRPSDEIEVAVVALPHISNFDDFLPLQRHPSTTVRWVESPRDVLRADLAVLPGTKSTVHDLQWLREKRLDRAIVARAEMQMPVLGICGGCQMLGARIDDPAGVESGVRSVTGLGLLSTRTVYGRDKVTRQVVAKAARDSFLCPRGSEVEGYFIHMGRAESPADRAAFELTTNGTSTARDGAISDDGLVLGTMIHGLFESPRVVESMIQSLAERTSAVVEVPGALPSDGDDEYDRLARYVRKAIDLRELTRLLERPSETR